MFYFTVGLVNMIKSNKNVYYEKTETIRQKCTKSCTKGSFGLQRLMSIINRFCSFNSLIFDY